MLLPELSNCYSSESCSSSNQITWWKIKLYLISMLDKDKLMAYSEWNCNYWVVKSELWLNFVLNSTISSTFRSVAICIACETYEFLYCWTLFKFHVCHKYHYIDIFYVSFILYAKLFSKCKIANIIYFVFFEMWKQTKTKKLLAIMSKLNSGRQLQKKNYLCECKKCKSKN